VRAKSTRASARDAPPEDARPEDAPPEDATPEGLRLAAFLPYRLNVAAALVSEGLARLYGARFGLGIPEWRVIATCGELGAVTAAAIGRHAHMDKVKVSRAAARLEARGLVRRAANPADRREAYLALTAAGEGVHGEIAALARAYLGALTRDFSAAERAALDRLLDKLARAAGQGIEPAP
jgi:DNA-binding MarR family transcriptional regulator